MKTQLIQLQNDSAAGIITCLKTIPQMKGLTDIHSSLIYIGVCLSVRQVSSSFLNYYEVFGISLIRLICFHYIQMLHNGLTESMQLYAPSIVDSLTYLCNSSNMMEDTSTIINLFSLASDSGARTKVDLSLAKSLSAILALEPNGSAGIGVNESIWKLLPLAAAATLAVDKWDSAHFLFELNAFERNEHCAVIAIAKLLPCIALLPGVADVEKNTNGLNGSSYDTITRKCEMVMSTYLNMASRMLLLLRQMENTSSYSTRPLRALCLLIETFARSAPFARQRQRQTDLFFPQMLAHSSRVDVSLGRQKHNDALGTYGKARRDAQVAAASADKEQDGALQKIPEAVGQE
jgi:hypothetical protein